MCSIRLLEYCIIDVDHTSLVTVTDFSRFSSIRKHEYESKSKSLNILDNKLSLTPPLFECSNAHDCSLLEPRMINEIIPMR